VRASAIPFGAQSLVHREDLTRVFALHGLLARASCGVFVGRFAFRLLLRQMRAVTRPSVLHGLDHHMLADVVRSGSFPAVFLPHRAPFQLHPAATGRRWRWRRARVVLNGHLHVGRVPVDRDRHYRSGVWRRRS
jgi:hypothetical protein